MNNVEISIPQAAINALLGYAVVFFGMILLICVVILLGKIMTSRQAAKKPAAAVPGHTPAAPAAVPELKVEIPAAPGSAGELKLYDVPDKEAAMIMAIVADKIGKPLNELRFKSIKEVK